MLASRDHAPSNAGAGEQGRSRPAKSNDCRPRPNPLWNQLATCPETPTEQGVDGVESLVQSKLTVGAPNDPYEQEADRIADVVMQMPEPALQPSPS